MDAEVMPLMKLKDVMSSDLITIGEDESVFAAVKKMLDRKIFGLVVVNSDGVPSGLLSERSLVKRFILRNRRPEEVPVKAVMRRPLPSVPISLPLSRVAEYLVQNGLERTTVTDNGRVVGYVTLTDMARYLSRQKIWDVLKSHRTSEFVYFCPRCGTGHLNPVYGEHGDIKVFSCDNVQCNYQE
jgi:CBS domain-containing protein